MPIHDWTRVPAGLFHDFHQTWTIHIKAALNSGLLPAGLSALVEQRAGKREPDVLAIESTRGKQKPEAADGGVLLMEPPAASIVRRTANETYADLANRIVVKHHLGRVVSVIEIKSPGNKDSRRAFREFVDKTVEFMTQGIHLLLIDLFPPTPRDPFGMHKAIWDEFEEESFQFPPGKDRLVVSYHMGHEREAYVEPIGLEDRLPPMALYLFQGRYIRVPLEETYLSTWAASPEEMRRAVETGVMPVQDEE